MHTDDEFYYGRRQTIRYDKTGQPSYTWQGLQPEDFLNPQEGDAFAHGSRHDQDVQHLVRCFGYHYRYNPSTLVLSGVKLRWAQPGLPQPAPDLMVVANVTEPERPRSLFDVAQEGTTPRLVLEVTSPRLAVLDLQDKVELYAQAEVTEYIIVDSGERPDNPVIHYRVVGYRRQGEQFLPIEPDARGLLYSATTRLWIGVHEQQTSIILIDGRTGKLIEPDDAYAGSTAAAQAEAAFRAQSIAAQLGGLGVEN